MLDREALFFPEIWPNLLNTPKRDYPDLGPGSRVVILYVSLHFFYPTEINYILLIL